MLQKAGVDGGRENVKAAGTIAAVAARHQGGHSFLDWKAHGLISIIYFERDGGVFIMFFDHFTRDVVGGPDEAEGSLLCVPPELTNSTTGIVP